MEHRFLVIAAAALITLLGYFQFPGHTYLQSDTQIYVPILEHLQNPQLLVRDIVAVKPHVSFSIYDEVSLALAALTRLDFQWVLEAQQLLFRFAGVVGLYLIATSMRFSPRIALLLAAALHLGATIGGPAVLSVEYEPVPRGFAVPLVLLSIGLVAHGRWTWSGIAAGAAILYHPPTVLPLLAALAVLVLWRKGEGRDRWHVVWAVLASTAVLLVLSGLQAGVTEKQVFLGHIDSALEMLQRYRGSYNWVTMWSTYWFWQHLVLFGAAAVAFLRLRPVMPTNLRVCYAVMSVYGLLMIPFSYVVLEVLKWSIMPQIQPARAVLFLDVIATLAAAASGILAAQGRRFVEAFLWFVVVYAVPANVRVLQILLPDLTDPIILRRFLVVVGLSALAVLAVWMEKRGRSLIPWVAALVLPFFLIPGFGQIQNYPPLHTPQLDQLAEWARTRTSTEAVFLFPDAGRGLQPGVFRARSVRAVYVDWKSGGQVNLLKNFADEWWHRWRLAIPTNYRTPDFPQCAKLGIDYVVLKHEHRLDSEIPRFENSDWVVYKVPERTE